MDSIQTNDGSGAMPSGSLSPTGDSNSTSNTDNNNHDASHIISTTAHSPNHDSQSAYKRASRKGAPKSHKCDLPGCNKVYTRAEHLQRHQLNHNPRRVFRCTEPGCEHKFVRADLLARHQQRHGAINYVARKRNSNSYGAASPPGNSDDAQVQLLSLATSIPPAPQPPSRHPQPYPNPEGFSQDTPMSTPLMAPTNNNHQSPHPLPMPIQTLSNVPPQHPAAANWVAPPMDDSAINGVRSSKPTVITAPNPGYYDHGQPQQQQHVAETAQMMPMQFNGMPYAQDNGDQNARDNFAAWLFNCDTQLNYREFPITQIPFLEGGLESAFNNNIHYDYDSLTTTSGSLDGTHNVHAEVMEDMLTETRRQQILHWFQVFRRKHPKYEPHITNLTRESGGDLLALNLDRMSDCLMEFWERVSPRLPIVHQHTFSSNNCSIFLLLVMIALGASSLHSRDETAAAWSEFGSFADIIVVGVRWEILTDDDASPPVSLWVAQALLLLEFYEKHLSSRELHERAHIYHNATLTLLRRGSPLIGRTGSESPMSGDLEGASHTPALDSKAWWTRWANTESMHRVVFVAFMSDVLHAAMFGHNADMAPHEIRLPLPCNDALWMAPSPDHARSVEANFRMCGVKDVHFLDGLKRALHGQEVQTNAFGRMIIMSGLLSVGWHLNQREAQLKWLELRDRRQQRPEPQNSWRKILLRAFDNWKSSFDTAMPDLDAESEQRGCSNGPVQSASALYHLAHICLHVSIVDCQVYTGVRRLLGRKVSTRDYQNAMTRMTASALLPSTRLAILHAFRFLSRVIVDTRMRNRGSGLAALAHAAAGDPSISAPSATSSPLIQYTARNDSDPHRPWVMYFSALAIWSFVRALRNDSHNPPHRQHLQQPQQQSGGGASQLHDPQLHALPASQADAYVRTAAYVAQVASLNELTESHAQTLHQGLPDLLEVMQEVFSGARSELLKEAKARMKLCKEIIVSSMG